MIIPPDVSNEYMVLGYAVVVLILVGLSVYVTNRIRRLRDEYTMLSKRQRNPEK